MTLSNPNPWIKPTKFMHRMHEHWEVELENVSSASLRETWLQIGKYFQMHIEDDLTGDRENWYILSPPTGTGKTEGTIIYAAMLSELDNCDHPGMLIVTRLKSDCERIARRINHYGVRDTATAFHSDTKHDLTELRDFPVLVITHKAYELALGLLGLEGSENKSKWPFFENWGTMEETRKLIVIDECIDIVENAQADLDGLRKTLGSIPQAIRDKCPEDIECIKDAIELLEQMHLRNKNSEGSTSKSVLLSEIREGEKDIPTFKCLTDLLDAQDLDKEGEHRERLKQLHLIFQRWRYYHKKKADHTLNTSRLLIPENNKGAVVMDATARTNKVYQLHEKSVMVAPPENSRTYENFTLFVSRGHRVGKWSMVKEGREVFPELVAQLNRRLKNKDVFMVVHKDVEPLLSKYDTEFILRSGHWGAIDGSNEWKDCNAVVLAGLPYLPTTWSINTFMALQGVQDQDWLGPAGRGQRQSLKLSRMSADIVQAINRICSRKVIDGKGNCPTSKGFLLLPRDKTEADTIIKNIELMMPGINIKGWKFLKLQKMVKTSNHGKALEVFLKNMKSGQTVNKRHVQNVIRMSPATMKRLIKQVRSPESELGKAAASLGVTIVVTGKGRSAKTYFKKA